MNLAQASLLTAALLASLMGQPANSKGSALRLAIPPQVAAQATARLSGETAAAVPILMLQNVEVVPGEALNLRVLGPPLAGSDAPTVMGTAALVGSQQSKPKGPPQKLTLAIPMTLRGCQLLAGRSEISLTLEIEDSEQRPALKWERAFFASPTR
jgi:hypothetical protein